jgi:hypothetical protein
MLLAVLLTACHKKSGDTDMYDAVVATAGIGVAFGSSPDVVHAKLGTPTQTVVRGEAKPENAADQSANSNAADASKPVAPRGKMVQDFYIAVKPGIKPPEMPDKTVAQLTLTYYDNKLVAVLNSYHPEEVGALTPPIVAQPVNGVQLGMKRSDIEAKMGKPNFGTMKDGWQFAGEDGSAVVIQPQYTKVESTGETLASAISIEFQDSTSSSGKGEFYDKRKKRQESIHNLTTK